MIVLVAAGDGFSDRAKLFMALDYWMQRLQIEKVVVEIQPGRPPELLQLVKDWCSSRNIPLETESATDEEWKQHGASVGRFLHRRILDKHKPERLIALPGRGGIDELLHQARASGVKLIEVA